MEYRNYVDQKENVTIDEKYVANLIDKYNKTFDENQRQKIYEKLHTIYTYVTILNSNNISGSAIGASVGSVIPGLGTIAGGLVGGIVDIFGGLFGGGESKESENERHRLDAKFGNWQSYGDFTPWREKYRNNPDLFKDPDVIKYLTWQHPDWQPFVAEQVRIVEKEKADALAIKQKQADLMNAQKRKLKINTFLIIAVVVTVLLIWWFKFR